jgi:hypothetical protein
MIGSHPVGAGRAISILLDPREVDRPRQDRMQGVKKQSRNLEPARHIQGSDLTRRAGLRIIYQTHNDPCHGSKSAQRAFSTIRFIMER